MDMEEQSAPVRRVAYLVSQYPAFSHAFISTEIDAMTRAGWEVHTFSVVEPSFDDPPGTRKTFVLQRHILRSLFRSAKYVARHPVATAHGLRAVKFPRLHLSRSDLSAYLKQLAYFYEAVVLSCELDRRQIPHLHVHFANNGAEIARLATSMRRVVSKQHASWSMTVHGPSDFEHAKTSGLRHKARAVDALFCISEFARLQLSRQVAPVDSARAVICRMGVTNEAFTAPISASPKPPDDVFRVLFVGRLVSKKDPAGLTRAVIDLAALPEYRGRRIDLSIVGEGPERSSIETHLTELPDNLSVNLFGAATHADVLAHYRNSDVFCLPSYSEGLPVVLMEALAAELAVISTPVAAIPELVINGESGLLVEPGDKQALIRALSELWDSPEARRAYGKRGRRIVERAFLSSTAADVLTASFDAVSRSGSLR